MVDSTFFLAGVSEFCHFRCFKMIRNRNIQVQCTPAFGVIAFEANLQPKAMILVHGLFLPFMPLPLMLLLLVQFGNQRQ